MMRAYLDESGHEGQGMVVVAGFFGTEDEWERFVPRWREALGPQRKNLHMSSLRWKAHRTRRLLEKLGPIPPECGLKRAVGGVRVSDYADLVEADQYIAIIKGYHAALVPLAVNVVRAVPESERIEFVFEEQHEYAPVVDSVMSMVSAVDEPYKRTKDGGPKVVKWGFVPKGTTIMTDPADYLAYATREHHTDPNSERAKWTKSILEAGGDLAYGGILTREQARERVVSSRLALRRVFGV
jgi:hypothetical protein